MFDHENKQRTDAYLYDSGQRLTWCSCLSCRVDKKTKRTVMCALVNSKQQTTVVAKSFQLVPIYVASPSCQRFLKGISTM